MFLRNVSRTAKGLSLDGVPCRLGFRHVLAALAHVQDRLKVAVKIDIVVSNQSSAVVRGMRRDRS